MSNEYGQDPIDHSIKEEAAPVMTNTDGDDIVEVSLNATANDDDWKYKLRDVVIIPKEANREGFKTFNRTFTTLGDIPSSEQQEKLKPILNKLYGAGYSLRCKDTKFSEEFYSWTESNYKRSEFYVPYKSKGSSFKPVSESVDNDAIAIALDAKITRFPSFDLEKFKTWKDIGKLMLGLNAHLLFGADLETPISFIILNTPAGEEPGDRVDFDTIGFNLDILLIAQRYNIPTFNLNKEGAFERLEGFVDASI